MYKTKAAHAACPHLTWRHSRKRGCGPSLLAAEESWAQSTPIVMNPRHKFPQLYHITYSTSSAGLRLETFCAKSTPMQPSVYSSVAQLRSQHHESSASDAIISALKRKTPSWYLGKYAYMQIPSSCEKQGNSILFMRSEVM